MPEPLLAQEDGDVEPLDAAVVQQIAGAQIDQLQGQVCFQREVEL